MKLTNKNYYSNLANYHYMSVSQFKDFHGSYGKAGCEACAMAKLKGKWEQSKTTALMVGSYVDSYFEGTLDDFKERNPEIFTKDGNLKADYRKAENIIQRCERDEYFMNTMSGEKQIIMTGKLFGCDWKIKMDSYIHDTAIVDLKIVESINKLKWVPDIGYLDFIQYWGYDIQGAIYQEVVRQNTGKRLPFFISAATKENVPRINVIRIPQNRLDEALKVVEYSMPRILDVKSGKVEPEKCEVCDYCAENHIITEAIWEDDLLVSL